MTNDYLRKHGITPGGRGNSNSPETFESDLVDETVDKIMGDREELVDVLGTVLGNLAPPAVVDMLALLVAEAPAESRHLSDDFLRHSERLRYAIEGMVSKFCEQEAVARRIAGDAG